MDGFKSRSFSSVSFLIVSATARLLVYFLGFKSKSLHSGVPFDRHTSVTCGIGGDRGYILYDQNFQNPNLDLSVQYLQRYPVFNNIRTPSRVSLCFSDFKSRY